MCIRVCFLRSGLAPSFMTKFLTRRKMSQYRKNKHNKNKWQKDSLHYAKHHPFLDVTKTAVGWEWDLKVFVRKRYCWDFHCLDFLFFLTSEPFSFCNLSRVRSGHPWGNRLAVNNKATHCKSSTRESLGERLGRLWRQPGSSSVCSDLLSNTGLKTSLSELHLSG